MFLEAYAFVIVGVLIFSYWQQREEGRNHFAALITGAFIILWVCTNTLPISIDNTTLAVGGFLVWMLASQYWNHSRHGILDISLWFVGMTLFMVGRKLSFQTVFPIVFIPALCMSAVAIYYYHKKATHPGELWPIFGNSNHNGVFYLMPIFIGAYMSVTYSYLFVIPTAVIVYALAISQCRAAQAGLIVASIFVACSYTFWSLFLIPVAGLIIWRVFLSRVKIIYNAFSGRLSLWMATIMIIRRNVLAGTGMRTFRREYPAEVPELLTHRLTRGFYAKGSTIESQCSHRAHNDHLETILELGVIGAILFYSIFTFLPGVDPILAGAIVAVAVDGFFFFPLREAHTAFPFWLFSGTLASTQAPTVVVPLMVGVVIILVVGRMMLWMATKLQGLYYYDQAVRLVVVPNPETMFDKNVLATRCRFIDLAIHVDPYNNVYLTEGYYYNVFNNPEKAFQYASRCMENYDGGKVKWGVADQYARALMRMGGFGVAKMALNHALTVCPDFKQSRELLNQIEKLEQQGAPK